MRRIIVLSGVMVVLAAAAAGEVVRYEPIRFTMPEDGYVSMQIRDGNGVVVRQLLNAARYVKGEHSVTWDGLTTPIWNKRGKPVPGAVMDDCPSGLGGEDFGGSLTQARGGKVYIQAGKLALWNVQVVGFETVKRLVGGPVRAAAAGP